MNDQPLWRQRAASYIQGHARPLEIALYYYEFDGGPLEAVLAALAGFQNDDGGFGRALEPDLRLADSSVIATTIAFQLFRHLSLPAETPMPAQAAGYLLAAYDPARQFWPIIPPNVDQAPHAPWWTYKDEPQAYLANPRAEIVGYLHDYPDLFPHDLRQSLTAAAIAWIEDLSQRGEAIEMHDLLCYIRLAESAGLPGQSKARLVETLRPMVKAAVAPDPAAWQAYGLTPLAVVSSPDSPFAAGLADLIPLNIDFILRTQSPDGSWAPAWNWAFADEAAWAKAERDIKGILTLNNLRLLAAFAAGE